MESIGNPMDNPLESIGNPNEHVYGKWGYIGFLMLMKHIFLDDSAHRGRGRGQKWSELVHFQFVGIQIHIQERAGSQSGRPAA